MKSLAKPIDNPMKRQAATMKRTMKNKPNNSKHTGSQAAGIDKTMKTRQDKSKHNGT